MANSTPKKKVSLDLNLRKLPNSYYGTHHTSSTLIRLLESLSTSSAPEMRYLINNSGNTRIFNCSLNKATFIHF